MAAVIADTHALIWYHQPSPRLSAAALAAMQAAVRAGEPIRVGIVSLVEIVYLIERSRVPADTFDRVCAILHQPNGDLMAVAFDASIAEALRRVPAAIVADLPDRMIAATALHLMLPLVTADQRMQALPMITTIW